MRLNKIIVGNITILAILSIFTGCSSNSAEEEMYSTSIRVGDELKDNGNSNYMAFKGAERIIITTVPTLMDAVNKAKCDEDELEKYGEKFNNSAINFTNLLMGLQDEYCDDGKMSNKELSNFQKKVIKKVAEEYDIDNIDLTKY